MVAAQLQDNHCKHCSAKLAAGFKEGVRRGFKQVQGDSNGPQLDLLVAPQLQNHHWGGCKQDKQVHLKLRMTK
jgi:hypothetical protein